MSEILEGRGKKGAFTPSPGIKEFLYELKAMKVKIGLVTSGLYEKAWPGILDAFKTLGMGDPNEFYDAVITAGHAIRKGEPGTLGELSPKPHPWLYAETARVGLGIPFDDRHQIALHPLRRNLRSRVEAVALTAPRYRTSLRENLVHLHDGLFLML